MSVIAYSLGAAEEVTGSKHVFEVDGKTFLIDCGAFQGKREETDKKNRNFDLASDKLEAVLLTHAHYDHCGLLPILTQKGFRGNIYATPATRDLANLIMMDSANIQARDAEFLRKKKKLLQILIYLINPNPSKNTQTVKTPATIKVSLLRPFSALFCDENI